MRLTTDIIIIINTRLILLLLLILDEIDECRCRCGCLGCRIGCIDDGSEAVANNAVADA